MIYQLTPDIYRLQIPFSNIYTCMFLIRTPEGTVVYDTGTYDTDISNFLLPALEELALGKPCAVVISHNHGDHAGGLAALYECFPDVSVYAGSDACGARINSNVQVLTDGEKHWGVLKAVHIPGHTADAFGIYDERTKSLVSGDCLQVYGIYGKGKWGSNIGYPQKHLDALSRLEVMDIQNLYAAHHYEPYGNEALGSEAVKNYIRKCRQALTDIEAYVATHPGQTPEELAEAYAKETGLPIVPAKSFAAFQQ